nr:4-(cytidine 5'-diphospho)-2-C-methyl-D-erythritol kinase [Massilia sp. WF1]
MTSLHGCPAPAKLNLFLHVTGRRPDGYHLLQSVFQLIDHGDTLDFDLRSDERIVRALRALQAEYRRRHGRLPPGIDVRIDKRLPMGGGLGGGSSDAATALMAANALWQAGLRDAELMAIGLPLGADIPFFLFGETAFAEGVGEALQAVPGPDCWYVVIEPGVTVPTAAIFTAPDLTRNTKPITVADFLGRQALRNDLQDVATRLFPPVAEAVEWLSGHGAARMTGSGACVFSAFSSEQEAEQVLKKVPAKWIAWKAKSLTKHPMKSLLQINEL